MAGVLSGRVNFKKLAIVYQPSVLDLELATIGWAVIIFIAPPPLYSPFVSLMFLVFSLFLRFFLEKSRSWSFNCSFMSLFHSLIKISSHKQIAPSWFYFPYLDKLSTANAKQKRVVKVWENACICAHCFPRPIMCAINAADTASHMHYNFFFVRVWISEMIKAKGSVRIPNTWRALVLFCFFSIVMQIQRWSRHFSADFWLAFTTQQFHTYVNRW